MKLPVNSRLTAEIAIICGLFVLPFGNTCYGQGGTTVAGQQQLASQLSPGAAQVLGAAAAQGFPLPTHSVSQDVSVEAVLLPSKVCGRVFSKEIAQNYAAIELIISNRSDASSLIVHSIFIDYGDWALSGSQYLRNSPQAAQTSKAQGSVVSPTPPTQAWQASTQPNQIASVEYRVVRGELLDASPWTSRNWIIRALKAAGSLASAYSFSLSEKGIVRGIAAYNGNVVPAAETFWPDATIGQMNRISDVGFQVNKVIPKSSSDIIVAFFPIDRFLTPGLKQLFLQSPAIFFAPYALIFDPAARKVIEPFLENLLGGEDLLEGQEEKRKKTADAFLKALTVAYMNDYLRVLAEQKSSAATPSEKSGTPQAPPQPPAASTSSTSTLNGVDVNKVMEFLSHASLNTVHVIVSGDMTVNVENVPATITSIEMEGGNNNSQTWSTTGTKKGVISGTFLSGGSPIIAEASSLGITDLAADAKNSTDKELHFSMTLKQAISSGQKLTFKVEKKDKQNNAVDSMPYVLPIQYTLSQLTGATLKNSVLTVLGQELSDSKAAPLKLLLYSDPSKTSPDFTADDTAFTVTNSSQVDVDLAKAKGIAMTPACWTVKAQIGGTDVPGSAQFAKIPSPTITSAGKQNSTIVVKGTQFVDLSTCDNDHHPLGFVLIDTSHSNARTKVSKYKIDSSTQASFDNPNAANTWQVVVQVDGQDVGKPQIVQ